MAPQAPELEVEHRVVNNLSARTGRVLPMRFQERQRAIEPDARHAVVVDESNAHLPRGSRASA